MYMHACVYITSRFLDSAEVLLKEAGNSVAKFDVCDNIDLSAILQVSSQDLSITYCYNMTVSCVLSGI